MSRTTSIEAFDLLVEIEEARDDAERKTLIASALARVRRERDAEWRKAVSGLPGGALKAYCGGECDPCAPLRSLMEQAGEEGSK